MKNGHFLKTRWFSPAAGGLFGLLYVIADEGVLDHVLRPGTAVVILHEVIDMVLPIVLGITMGIVLEFYRRQTRMNESLSLKKEKLERELLFNMLVSQIMHEIQNPLHNISAAFEPDEPLTAEKQEIIRRNLARLGDLKKRYGTWELNERFDPSESFSLKPWLSSWIDDRMSFQFAETGIQYTQEIADVRVFAHPVLVEQMLTTLFENAVEAARQSADKKALRLEVRAGDGVEILLSNTGPAFPREVLENRGRRPVASVHGLGLGLLLLGKVLEQINGRMSLSSEGGWNTVTLNLPGERA